jgi:uncharacterized protein (DUF983 family)
MRESIADDDDADGWAEPESPSVDSGSLAPCPHCGEFIFDESERCPRCNDWIEWDEGGTGGWRIVRIAIVAALLIALFIWTFV